MNVTLRPDHERFIQEQVQVGHFTSADDAIAAAIDRMQRNEEEIVATPDDIASAQRGLDQLRQGQGILWPQARAQVVSKIGLK